MNQEAALPIVLQAYVTGLTHTYWITTACAIAAFFSACGLQWKSVKKGHSAEKAKEVDVEKAKDIDSEKAKDIDSEKAAEVIDV